MEQFTDNGIVLAARQHGEGAAVITLLTENNGKHAGYLHGGYSSARLRAQTQSGAMVSVNWNARTEGQLGSYTIEDSRPPSPVWLDDAASLAALQSICITLDRALPEREAHPALYAGTVAMLEMLGQDRELWGAALVFWELSLLRELGFGLDLSRCAVTDTTENLIYVSPKSGRAVSEAAAGPYKEKLLPLPAFLRGEGNLSATEIVTGLKLSGYFLEHRLYAHTTHALPEPRQRLLEFFAEK